MLTYKDFSASVEMTVNVLFLNVIYMLLSNDKLYTSVEMTVNVLLPNDGLHYNVV